MGRIRTSRPIARRRKPPHKVSYALKLERMYQKLARIRARRKK